MNLRETVTLAASGDAGARRQLVERFYPTVQRLVHEQLARSFRQHHAWIWPLFSTGDVVHDVLVDVIRGVGAFEGEVEAEFAGYLAAAVGHRLIDAVRHHEAGCRDARRRDPGTVADLGSTGRGPGEPAAAAVLGEQMTIFRAQLAALPEADRVLIELRLGEELPFSAIAAKLGYASDNSARKAFDRAQARLALRLRAAGLRPERGT